MRIRAACLLMAAAAAWNAPHTFAQAIVKASAPEQVSVTIYRDPQRSEGGTLDLHNLRGFALITETRTIDLPAGESRVRFEGVADGIVATSALVAGLPGGVVEKNRDARLLSPAALIETHLGKEVTLIRTDRATGRLRTLKAIVRSGPDGVVFDSSDGIEAMRCAGLPERLVFDALPDDLSARPTLSVVTRAPAPVKARVVLAYLARGFDWSANYVAQLRPDGKSLDLLAWVTLANGNSTSFAGAGTQVVAGTLNRRDTSEEPLPPPPSMAFRCWPMDSTSTHPRWTLDPPIPMTPPPIVSAPMMARAVMSESAADVIVTARKVVEEQLGDLKLYRVPEPTTVAALGQKQVLLLDQKSVPYTRIYRARHHGREGNDPEPMTILLRTRNDRKNNLGLALPAGSVATFEAAGGRPMLAGEDRLRDSAVNEEVEISVGAAPGVRMASHRTGNLLDITLSNDTRGDIQAEVEKYLEPGARVTEATPAHALKNGRPVWRLRVPAGGTARISAQLSPLRHR